MSGISDAEKQDLKIMLEKRQQLVNSCFAVLGTLDLLNPQGLAAAGYSGKTNAEAMQLTYRHFKRDVQKLEQAHVQKYPDHD